MSNTLYLECQAGISGDMMVAALLDLGANKGRLMETLDSIPAEGFSIEISRVKKAGIDCCDFHVALDAAHENHDHDMEYLHGHGHTHGEQHDHNHAHMQEGHHDHNQVHSQEGQHDHNHAHTPEGHHSHEHRGIAEVREILAACRMTARARQTAERIFAILAEAEARAHDVPVSEVHFHEVGAIDSIVDIVAVAFCLDDLEITDVIVPGLCEGTGTVRCQHGVLPVPVPAVAQILSAHGIGIEIIDVRGEFVTPTGAAIVAAVRTAERLPRQWKILKTGMGAGKRNYERPSILRAMLIEAVPLEQAGAGSDQNRDAVWKLETNIDDSSGEMLGYAMERLFQAGARDVHYMPVYMKKNRPAWQLNVICAQEDIPELERILFTETTTIGIRRVRMERTVLPREQMTLKTGYGEAQVKVCETADGKRYYPEYDSIVTICAEHGLAFSQAYELLARLAADQDRKERQ